LPEGGILAKTRRTFLTSLILAGTAGEWVARLMAQQAQEPMNPQERKPGQESTPDSAALPSADKRLLEGNEKDIKKKVERLYELATELKAEVDKTDSSKVLSLNLMKKAEEVEKLAREIKNRSKG
jgi:hypothetical protein